MISFFYRLLAWRHRLIKRPFSKLFHVARALFANEISKYPSHVKKFERDFAKYSGCKYGLTFSNGTTSIEAAIFAVGIGEGDDVLVPPLTMHASISPILNAGANPVFVDVDLQTLNVDPEELERKITPNTKAILVVHLFGNPAGMDKIMKFAAKRGLKVIEDCSHAHGARYKGRSVGSFGDVGCFSLQQDKPVSAGEGAVAVTNDRIYFERMALFGHFDRVQGELEFPFHEVYGKSGLGHKGRAHPLAISIASVDFRSLDRVNRKKAGAVKALKASLSDIPGVEVITTEDDCIKGGYNFVPVVMNGSDTSSVVKKLRSAGIPASRINYRPWHLDPFFLYRDYRKKVVSDVSAGDGVEPLPKMECCNTPHDCPGCPNSCMALQRGFLMPIDGLAFSLQKSILRKVLGSAVQKTVEDHQPIPAGDKPTRT